MANMDLFVLMNFFKRPKKTMCKKYINIVYFVASWYN